MEQELINALICFISKAGGESFTKNILVHEEQVNRVWTEAELARAISHMHWINEIFGQSDAAVVIGKLLEMYSIDVKDLSLNTPN